MTVTAAAAAAIVVARVVVTLSWSSALGRFTTAFYILVGRCLLILIRVVRLTHDEWMKVYEYVEDVSAVD
jgi:hypothetical protein